MAGPAGGAGGFGGGPPGGSTVDKKAAEELAAVMGRVRDSAQGVARAFEDQLKVIEQLKSAMNEVAGATESISRVSPNAIPTEKWAEAADEIERLTKSGTAFGGIAGKLQSAFGGGTTKAAFALGGAVSGLKAGFGALTAVGSSVVGVFASIADAAFSLGAAILSIPFKMLDGLIGMAMGGGGGGGGGLQEALEEIRARFGDIKGPMSDAIYDSAKMSTHFNMAGISALKAFGPLPERVKKVNAAIMAMGNAAIGLLSDIRQLGDGILAFNSGLGITEDMMPGIATWVTKTGQSMEGLYVDITKQSKKMAAAMGINAKVMSSDMVKAMQDTAHFGHMSTTAIAAVTAYTQKLGISIEKLTGMMDKFSTFEGAAESASQLNSALGLNIDAMELMEKAQEGPGAQLDYLREQMKASGKDMGQLTFAQRKLFAEASGMDQNTLDQAFASKNAETSLDKFTQQAEETEKQTWSTKDALKSLKNDIQRFISSGGGGEQPKSFLEAFMKGFGAGMQQLKEFKELMKNIKASMKIVETFGKKIGAYVAENFPGIKKMIDALAKLFDPAKFTNLMQGFENAVKKFLGPGGKLLKTPREFINDLKDVFFDFFGAEKGAANSFMEGFHEFLPVVTGIMSALLNVAIDGLTSIITFITNWIKNPSMPDLGGGDSKWAAALAPLKDSLNHAAETLWPALKELGAELWKKIKEGFIAFAQSDAGKTTMYVLAGILFGPAILGAVLGALTHTLILSIGKMLGNVFGGAGDTQDVKTGLKTLSQKIDKLTNANVKNAQDAINNVDQSTPKKSLIEKLKEIGDAKINWDGVKKFFWELAKIMLLMAGTFGLAILALGQMDLMTIIKGSLTIFIIVKFLIPPVIELAKSLQQVPEMSGSVGLKLLTLGLIMAAGLVPFLLGALAVQSMKISLMDIVTVSLMIGASLALIYATSLLAKALSSMSIDPKALLKPLIAIAVVMAVGMAAFIGGVKAMQYFKISQGDILNTVLLFTGATVIMLEAAAATLIAAALGKMGGVISNAVTGLAAMGIILGAMVVAMAIVAGMGKLFGASDMKSSMEALHLMSLVFMETGVIIAEATAIGAAVIASAGIAGGIALAGLGAMGVVVGELAGVAVKVMNELGKIKEDPGQLKTKVEAFATIVMAISSVTETIARMLEALQGGFSKYNQTGNTKMIDAVTNLVREVVGGLSRLVETIKKQAATMSESEVKSTESFAKVLTAVAELIRTMMDPIVKITEISSGGWFTSTVTQASNIGNTLRAFGTVFSTITQSVGSVIRSIVDAIKSIPKENADAIAAAGPGIGSILEGVAALMSAVIGPLTEFRRTASASGALSGFGLTMGGTASASDVDVAGIGAVAGYLATTMPLLEKHMGPLVAALAKGAGDALKGLSNEQLAGLGPIAQMMTAVAQMLSSVANIITAGAPPKPANDVMGKVMDFMNGVKFTAPSLPTIGQALDAIKDKAPELIKSIIAVASGLGTNLPSEEQMKTVASALEIVSKFPEIIDKLPKKEDGWFSSEETDAEYKERLKTSMDNLADVLSEISKPGGSVSKVMDAAKNFSSMTAGDFKAEGIDKVVDALKEAKNLAEKIADLDADDIDKDDISEQIKALDDIHVGMMQGPKLTDVINKYTSLAPGLSNVDSFINLGSNIQSMADGIPKIVSGLRGLAANAPLLSTLDADIEKLRSVGLASMQNALKVAAEMSENLKAISGALGGVGNLDISADMTKIAGKMAVGQTAKYTLQANKEVTINMTVTVMMDGRNAGDIIAKSGSKLSTAIDTIIENGASKKGEEKTPGIGKLKDTPGLSNWK